MLKKFYRAPGLTRWNILEKEVVDVPIEIVSKVILRHANLSTTQRYLGTVSDAEAMRWIDNLYG